MLEGDCATYAMENSNSLSAMPRGMLIGIPCFLVFMRIGAAGWEPMGRSFRLGGPRASERALLASLFAHSPKSGGMKGAAGAALSNVGGVGRDKPF